MSFNGEARERERGLDLSRASKRQDQILKALVENPGGTDPQWAGV